MKDIELKTEEKNKKVHKNTGKR